MASLPLRWRRIAAGAAAAALLAVGCGEPAVPLEIPDRQPGQRVLDMAGILDADALEEPLAALQDSGWDVVALTFTDEAAGLGLAHRAGNRLVQEWSADVAIVAVARSGDFASLDEDRQRFFGIASPDAYGVPRSVREIITEEIVPPVAARNDWQGAFLQAAVALAGGLQTR